MTRQAHPLRPVETDWESQAPAPHAAPHRGGPAEPSADWAVLVADSRLRVMDAAGRVLPMRADGRPASLRRQVNALLGPGAWRELDGRLREAVAGKRQSFMHPAADGRDAHRIEIVPVTAGGGTVLIVAIVRDSGIGTYARAELERSEARLRQTERMAGVGSWELAADDGSITCSPGCARVLGLAPGAPLSVDSYEAMVHPEDRAAFRAVVAACASGGAGSCEHRIVRPDGTARTVVFSGEKVVGGETSSDDLRGVVLDVTEQRELERERMAALALFDQGFDVAPIAMALSDPVTGRYVRVNDAMCVLLGRSRDDLMRMSVSDITHPDDRQDDREVQRALREGDVDVHRREKRYIRPDGSLVWAEVHVVPVRGADGAVQALFAQKSDITERKERDARLAGLVSDAAWLGRIREALDNDGLLLYEQPIIDLRTGATVQRELLLRLRDENGRVVAPGEFLPIAERYGLISEIDRWVIREAAALAADGTPTELNLSAASIGNADVLRELRAAIDATGVDPSLLVVEVTETAMIDQPDEGRRFADAVRALGCGLALDDFGTGFACLKYLKHLAADHLKIDIEFVRDIASNPPDERLVRGIVGLAREFNQVTTAEGIEDEETLTKLRELGVDRGQGYLFARPSPVGRPAPAPAVVRQRDAGTDAVAVVKAAFQAFAARDLQGGQRLCHPDVALRMPTTATATGRAGSYRGHGGIAEYLRDVSERWDELRTSPVGFWEVNGAVVASGHVLARRDGTSLTSDALWVCRLRDGLILTIDVFEPSRRSPVSESVSGDCLLPQHAH
jgi:PAS domain S-box-containing protein